MMILDELARIPTFNRLTSTEPKEGYFYQSFAFNEGDYWVEGDALFKPRFLAHIEAMKASG